MTLNQRASMGTRKCAHSLWSPLRYDLSILLLLMCGHPKWNALYLDQRRRALQVVAPIAKSAAVHSTSCVAVMPALAARRVWIRLQDVFDGVGWHRRQPKRREEFVHRARRPSFRRRCGSDGSSTSGPTAAHRYPQRHLSARILPGFLVPPYMRAVIAPFS